MNKNWKVKFLPFFYRECPSGNAHWVGNHICYCCEGKDRNWTYVWKGKENGWVAVDFALNTASNHSFISWSGQFTTWDLIWNGTRTGLLIGIIGIVLFGMFLYQLKQHSEIYQKNVQYKYESITEPPE